MAGTRTLFLLSVAIALSALFYQPICNAAHPHVLAGEPPSCCLNADGPADAKVLDQSADGPAKPPLANSAFAYVITTAPLLVAATAFTSASPPRSFYERSTRILR